VENLKRIVASEAARAHRMAALKLYKNAGGHLLGLAETAASKAFTRQERLML
jgi:hypothetical protein